VLELCSDCREDYGKSDKRYHQGQYRTEWRAKPLLFTVPNWPGELL